MDVDTFDAWTRGLLGRHSRRSTLAVLGGAAAALGWPLTHASARKKKTRCKKADRGCGPGKQCCRGLGCTAQTCCPPERVYVQCPDVCLCAEDPNFCCADQPDPPEDCPTQPDTAPEFCCPASSICGENGEECCDPGKTCVDGVCQCLPENVCGQFCCDPRFRRCDHDTNLCSICLLPPPQDCPSGSGGFSRVRRFP